MLKQVQHDGLWALACLIVAAAPALPVEAKPPKTANYEDIDPYWRSCPNRESADSGQLYDMKVCAARSFKLADRELNRVFRLRMSSLAPNKRQALLHSQRRWLGSRDRDADKCANPWGPDGHEYPFVFTTCQVMLTLDRTKILRTWK